mmetsp:Transcript_18275/g.27752  ORF Transcript_18275/g.27752 Transcript_18275/m.27752 type:complete len:165 (+) Transcript_18275:6-500(+)
MASTTHHSFTIKLLPVLPAPAADTTNYDQSYYHQYHQRRFNHHTSRIVKEDTTTNNLSRILSEEEDITTINTIINTSLYNKKCPSSTPATSKTTKRPGPPVKSLKLTLTRPTHPAAPSHPQNNPPEKEEQVNQQPPNNNHPHHNDDNNLPPPPASYGTVTSAQH